MVFVLAVYQNLLSHGGIGRLLEKQFSLPFAPFPGLTITDPGGVELRISSLWWNIEKQIFEASLPIETYDTTKELDKAVDELIGFGWK